MYICLGANTMGYSFRSAYLTVLPGKETDNWLKWPVNTEHWSAYFRSLLQISNPQATLSPPQQPPACPGPSSSGYQPASPSSWEPPSSGSATPSAIAPLPLRPLPLFLPVSVCLPPAGSGPARACLLSPPAVIKTAFRTRSTSPTSSCFYLREAPDWLRRSTPRSTRIYTPTHIHTWTGKYTSTSISTTSVSSGTSGTDSSPWSILTARADCLDTKRTRRKSRLLRSRFCINRLFQT